MNYNMVKGAGFSRQTLVRKAKNSVKNKVQVKKAKMSAKKKEDVNTISDSRVEHQSATRVKFILFY